jgi:hypothetical protein
MRLTDDERLLVESSQSARGRAVSGGLVAVFYRWDCIGRAFARGVGIESAA